MNLQWTKRTRESRFHWKLNGRYREYAEIRPPCKGDKPGWYVRYCSDHRDCAWTTWEFMGELKFKDVKRVVETTVRLTQ